MASNATSHDEDGGVLGLIAGVGIVLTQAAALIPGLLPVLLLTLPLVLPLLVLGIAGGVLVGVPFGLWRLGVSILGLLRRRVAAGVSARIDRAPTETEVGVG